VVVHLTYVDCGNESRAVSAPGVVKGVEEEEDEDDDDDEEEKDKRSD